MSVIVVAELLAAPRVTVKIASLPSETSPLPVTMILFGVGVLVSASSSLMVPIAKLSFIDVPLLAFESVILKNSDPSKIWSSVMATVMDLLVSPAAK